MKQPSIQNRQKPGNIAQLAKVHSLREFDQLQEVAKGISLEIVQLQPGIIHGEFVHFELSHSSIHSNSYCLPVRGYGPTSEGRWSFAVFPHHVSGTFNGETLESPKVLVYRSGGEFEGTTHGAFDDWAFTVEDAELRRAVRNLFRLELPDFPSTCSVLLPEPRLLERLRRFAKSSLALGRMASNSPFTSDLRASLHRELTEHLARIVMSGRKENSKVNRTALSHSQIVRRSEDYFSAHLNTPMTLMEICSAIDVSERTLRNAFQSVLGVNPNTYMKIHRLQIARRQLVQSAVETATVTAIAHSSGFSHLGYFSRDYRKFFGESPSQTLSNLHSK